MFATKIFSISAVALLLIMLPLLIQAEQNRPIYPLIDSPGNTIGSDFNGDGIHDIIIGAHRNDDCAAGLTCGAVYIFFGATNLSGTKDTGAGAEDVKILGKGVNDRLGRVVSSAGDLNGDGLDDIIVGAYNNNDGGSNDEGAAYIFFGATNLSGTKDTAAAAEDVRILGKGADDFLGINVSGAGDVNGDGFDDFIVGARQNNDGGSNDEGAAYIFFGASNLSGTFDMGGGVQSANVTIFGKASTDLLGFGVAGAGDVNGDGFDDIIVGARNNNDGGSNDEGAAYIFFGASDFSGTKRLGGADSADVTILGKAATDQLGTSVSGVGDVNGDGFDDFIIGADQNDDGGSNDGGAAYIFFGSSDLSGTKALGGVSSADFTILGKGVSDFLGRGISGVGDVNGDGVADFCVGADATGSAAGTGAAYVFFGASDLGGTKDLGGVQSADVSFLGKTALDSFGISIGGGRSSPGP